MRILIVLDLILLRALLRTILSSFFSQETHSSVSAYLFSSHLRNVSTHFHDDTHTMSHIDLRTMSEGPRPFPSPPLFFAAESSTSPRRPPPRLRPPPGVRCCSIDAPSPERPIAPIWPASSGTRSPPLPLPFIASFSLTLSFSLSLTRSTHSTVVVSSLPFLPRWFFLLLSSRVSI